MHPPAARSTPSRSVKAATLVGAVVLAAGLGACGSDGGTTDAEGSVSSTTTAAPATSAPATTPPTTAPTTTEPIPVVPGQVVVRDYEFLPATVTVAVGETITWQNTDEVDHWVLTQDETTVDSGPVTPGQAFTATLSAPGSYPYYCDIHNSMTGTIVVE